MLTGSAVLVWSLIDNSDSGTGQQAVSDSNNEISPPGASEPPAPEPSPLIPSAPVPPSVAETKPAAASPPLPVPVPPDLKTVQPPVVKPEPPVKTIVVQPPPAKIAAVARGRLTGEEQTKVDEAIERGVRFLKKHQIPTGSWRQDGFHGLGYAALPGLTLLECQVPAKDPVVQRAASFVRRHVHSVIDTYDLALALLFLDRLGERSDRALIQQIALRLVASQTGTGGWSYESPGLTPPEMAELMLFLHQTRPHAAQLSLPAEGKPEQKSLAKEKSAILGKSLDASRKPKVMPKDSLASKTMPATNTGTRAKVLPKSMGNLPTLRTDSLPPIIRRLAIVNPNQGKDNGFEKFPAMAKGKWMHMHHMHMLPTRDDNSNSQFAMLALWAARRHDVPTERSLQLADKRYHTSQNKDGGWGYQIGMPTTSAMTGVGLLGLAIGHASSDEGLRAAAEATDNKNARNLLRDPAIQDGLEAFAQYVGGGDDPPPFQPNLYFLWTVERVAMLYNLPTIGNKDWYRWGVRILLPTQQPAGAWMLGGYPGADTPIDTSFALLFLKQSNLVKDLTRNLTFYLAITDPASATKRSNAK